MLRSETLDSTGTREIYISIPPPKRVPNPNKIIPEPDTNLLELSLLYKNTLPH